MKRAALLASLVWVFFAVPAAAQRPMVATYFGGPGNDRLTAAAVLPDRTILVAGAIPGEGPKTYKPIETLEGSGDGILLRLSETTHKVLSATRFKGAVSDLDLDASGHVYVTGAFGSAKLDSSVLKTMWTSGVGGPDARIARGPSGSVAVLSKKTVTLIDAHGKTLRSWKVGASYVNDVVCDTRNRLVIVTGFHNRRGQVPGEQVNPVQVAFVYAYGGTGEKVWTAYDWKGQEVAQRALMADTRGYRLAMGRDGKLYLAGESAGGNTIWRRKSNDLDEPLPLAKGDTYQRLGRTRANHITFAGRMNPKTGETEAGTMLLARMPDGSGNTIRPRALAADASGRVYVAGKSATGMPISKGAFGSRLAEGGAFFCIFDRNFKRLYASRPCAGNAAALALGQNVIVLAGESEGGLPQVRALQRTPGGGETEGWTVVFSVK